MEHVVSGNLHGACGERDLYGACAEWRSLWSMW